MVEKISIRCCTINDYNLYLKSFKQSSLASTTMIYLVKHFNINKSKKLIVSKYYRPSHEKDVEAYVKDNNIYLALKVVKYKFYNYLQILPVLIY